MKLATDGSLTGVNGARGQVTRIAWEARFGDPPRRVRLIARTEQASVWRVLGKLDGQRVYILKLVRDARAAARELAAHAQVVSRLRLITPPVISGGMTRGSGGYIAFADDRLREVRPRRVADMMGVLAMLHGTVLQDVHVPDAAQSHTPGIAQVAQGVQAVAPEECARWLAPFTPREEDTLLPVAILEGLQQRREPIWQETGLVLCHGDAHAANFMSTVRGGRLRLIDWEYVHLDYPYFDIFQLLDATSPRTPLPVYASRLQALSAYHACAMDRLPAWEHFAQAYLRYALTHLFWILSRIYDDYRRSFNRAALLTRQAHETRRLISSMAEDWRSVTGEPFCRACR